MKKLLAFIIVIASLFSLSVMAKETFSTKTTEREKSETNPGNNWVMPLGGEGK